MTREEQKAVEEFTEMNLTKKGLYHYNDMQDAFLIGLFKGENMQPSLPSNLDEAAEKYSENILANNEDLQDAIEDAFKEGAKWMAGQGVTKEMVVTDTNGIIVSDTPLDLSCFRSYEEVIVQIRKKQ